MKGDLKVGLTRTACTRNEVYGYQETGANSVFDRAGLQTEHASVTDANKNHSALQYFFYQHLAKWYKERQSALPMAKKFSSHLTYYADFLNSIRIVILRG